MDRREFVTAAAIGGSAALATPAIAQGKRTLTLVATWPRGFAGVWDSAVFFADGVKDITDGNLTIDLKAAGELVGAFESFDAVTSGQADMYHGADYYFTGQHPGYNFFTTIPFGMNATEFTVWYHHGGGRDLHDELGKIFNLKSFIAGNSGAQTGGWFNKAIDTPEDFNELRFRIPGMGGQVLTALGASIQNLPPGEIYNALASGAIDGADWIGPWADESMGLHEIAPIYYTSSFHEPGAALTVATNRDIWDSLSLAHQRAIELTCAAAHEWCHALFLANNSAALARLKAGGTDIRVFNDDLWDAFGTATEPVVAKHLDNDLYKEIFESYSGSLRSTAAWLSKSSGIYSKQRDRVLGI